MNSLAFDPKSVLARVWLAAHWDKKLSKNQIYQHDVTDSVIAIKNGSLYSLRISGYLLLGLSKIYNKKSFLTLEEIEQLMDQVSQGIRVSGAETLKSMGITNAPEKLRLNPLKILTPETMAMNLVQAKQHQERMRNNASADSLNLPDKFLGNDLKTNTNQKKDLLGRNTTFLDDVQLAAAWLQKEGDEPLQEEEEEENKDGDFQPGNPTKRHKNDRTPVWQTLINPNPPPAVEDTEAPLDAPADVEMPPAIVPLSMQLENTETKGKTAPPKVKKEEDAKPPVKKEEKQPQKSSSRKAKGKTVRYEDASIVLDYDMQAGLDSTADIVKNPRFFYPIADLVPPDSDTMLYSTTVPDMNPELETFYISNIKLLRMKTHLRELEEENKAVSQPRPHPHPIEKPKAIENSHNKENIPDKHTEIPPQENVHTNISEPIVNKVEKTEETKLEDQWNSRTLKLLKLLKVKFDTVEMINFDDLSKKKERRVMACGFYELLQLALKDFIFLSQFGGQIIVRPTERIRILDI